MNTPAHLAAARSWRRRSIRTLRCCPRKSSHSYGMNLDPRWPDRKEPGWPRIKREPRKTMDSAWSIPSASIQIGWDEVSHLIIRSGAVPHAALRVEEELFHRVFRVGVGEFSHLPRFGIEAADDVHLVGRIPDVVITVDPQRVRSRAWSGQIEF